MLHSPTPLPNLPSSPRVAPSRPLPNLDSRSLAIEKSNEAISLLLHCRSNPYTVDEVKQYHAHVLKLGSYSNISFINSLIYLYGVNGSLDAAHRLFEESPQRDVVSWTTLVDGYAKSGNMAEARKLFDLMPERNIVSWNALISGYGRNGDADAARGLFDGMLQRDIVSWNSLISAYARNGLSEEVFETFRELLLAEFMPNRVSILSVLPAIADLGHSFRGRCLHSFITKVGIEVDNMVCSALIDMYSKCGLLEMAFQVFKSKPGESIASWNPMLAGLIRHKSFEEGLELFRLMQLKGVEPDYVTMVVLLPAIVHLGALGIGKWVHSYIERKEIALNATLGSALIDMYSKCGCIEIAQQVFDRINRKTVELCNAMISGLGIHGRGRDALELFSQMHVKDIKFDDITLAAVLNACSHSGLVDEGLSLFAAMTNVYVITPKIQHYGCVVDLLGRAGLLERAEELIKNMPMKPDAIIWKSLLGACRVHGNVEIGELAARNLVEFYPDDSSSYVLMSNIYEAAGLSSSAVKTRKVMSDGGIRKEPGFSSVELGGVLHEFLVGDRSHPRAEEIYAMLDEMSHKLQSVGYVPNTKLVLLDVDDEGKEAALFHHSERLAIAFGLINSSHGEPLHVIKNIRMCDDCHVFVKFLSKIYDREIIVRDHQRFHCFRNGTCSCMDYW